MDVGLDYIRSRDDVWDIKQSRKRDEAKEDSSSRVDRGIFMDLYMTPVIRYNFSSFKHRLKPRIDTLLPSIRTF